MAWRSVLHRRFRAILEDALPDQRLLASQLMQIARAYRVPMADLWIQGEGRRMAVQVLDAKSWRELWLRSGTP